MVNKLSGGKKKAAKQSQNKKYSKYRDGGRRETNKARRIVKNILLSAKPGETAYKVIDAYKEGSKHAKADNVVANITRALNKRNITPTKPEVKDA